MKLKSILGVCVATAAMTASCFNCFAADEAITYGAPIDLATAQEVSGDIVAGTHIAVPVELSNSDGRTTSFAAKVLYDDEYVTPGATDSELSDDEYNNLIALGNSDDGCVLRNSTSTTDLIVKNIYTLGRGGKKTIQGTWVAVPNSESINKFAVAWASGTADGTTTYEFPVRVNSATGATNAIDVDIYATTTADEAGATTSTDKKIGSINLTMDGTVTSYTTVDGTIAK